MSKTRIQLRATLFVCALFCLLVPSSVVAAGVPASVTVRVEGLTETKVPPTILTTTTAPVVKDGNPSDSCSGTSALGALELATGGNWSGPWETSFHQYSIFTIAGETHEFEKSSPANYFWAFWLNNKEASAGACETELQPNDQVLFFPSCYGTSCPIPAPTPLAIEAPPTANAGEAVMVTVKQYNSKGEASPAVGANIIGGGAGASTDSQGHASLKFFGAGAHELRVSGAPAGPPTVRTETTICVHEGNDGTCGTTAPSKVITTTTKSTVPKPEKVHHTLAVYAGGVLPGHVYSPRHAPRVLSGRVVSTVPITSISIKLRRSYRGRCWSYNATRERLQRVRCGRGSFFKVSSGGASFSYLLPFKLPPGHYEFDVKASDAAGDHSVPILGSSRIAFYVK